jgi:hypothetical protein
MAGVSPRATVAVFVAALVVLAPAAFAQVPPPAFCPSGGNCDNPAPCGSGCNTCDSPEHCSLCPPDGGIPVSFGTGGKAELPGNDLVVTTGTILDAGINPGTEHEAGPFMHELGHNFGLRHGGAADTPDFLPNYLSVMNDNFVYVGIPVGPRRGSADLISCRVSADCPAEAICGSFGHVCTRIDYSRQALPTLDEASLDESAGIGAGTNDITIYNCPDFTPLLAPAAGPIDWNCNGDFTDTRVEADINGDGHYGPFVGHRDWGSLNFHFQCWPGDDPLR